MEYLGYALALLALGIAVAAMHRISILEHKIKALSEPIDYVVLINTLKENMGKEMKIDFFEDVTLLMGRKCVVLDLDDIWIMVQIREKKTKEEKLLIRLDNIKNVTIL
ncbi:MAG: hypothetical protein K2M08_08005 [Anaeroplasmataceae bacterium]|nr:hypothetical protein [Anaeroplasmataceae bacterium]